MDILLLSVSLIGLDLLGTPIALAMILLPTVYILITDMAPILTVPHQMYEALRGSRLCRFHSSCSPVN